MSHGQSSGDALACMVESLTEEAGVTAAATASTNITFPMLESGDEAFGSSWGVLLAIHQSFKTKQDFGFGLNAPKFIHCAGLQPPI